MEVKRYWRQCLFAVSWMSAMNSPKQEMKTRSGRTVKVKNLDADSTIYHKQQHAKPNQAPPGSTERQLLVTSKDTDHELIIPEAVTKKQGRRSRKHPAQTAATNSTNSQTNPTSTGGMVRRSMVCQTKSLSKRQHRKSQEKVLQKPLPAKLKKLGRNTRTPVRGEMHRLAVIWKKTRKPGAGRHTCI